MKSLMSLWSCMADELAMRCCTSATRDIKTVARRIEHEGLSFLAITLAGYGKAIEKWLDHGFVVPSDVTDFKWSRRTGFPAFLSGFLARVFDPSSGVLLDDPDVEAIYAIRQLTLAFSKIALPAPPKGNGRLQTHNKVVSAARERRAMSEFVQCEQDVKVSDANLDEAYLADFRRMSEVLFGDVFAKVDRDVYWGRTIPKHGPGATADRLSSNGKFRSRTWTTRLQRVFPAEEFLIPNSSFRGELEQELDVLEPGSELPVRVITVPKTLKAPRVIAIEPTCMQYVQQALAACLRSAIDEDGFLARTVGFTDQEPNRVLACEGSHSGDLATLDLSEASDRVSNQLVLEMMSGYPALSAGVQASRSRKADVPGHGVLRLAKFASMGSALCFPVEAMVFLTVIFLGIERELSAPLSRRQLIKLFDGKVRVFGDDLIVPREYVLSVVSELETFGFRVNTSKSFWAGRFRESCGREFYDGQDVSIVKVRRELPTRRTDASGINSTVELRNLMYKSGMWQTAGWLDRYIGRLLKVFPNVAPTSPLLGRTSYLGYQFQKLDPKTQGPLTKGFYLRSESPRDFLDGSSALLKCLLQGEPVMGRFALADPRTIVWREPISDTEHLERSGRPEHVSIKLGWKPPF